ncbi:MAG: helix-turn-helix domain-containing protein [Burkholderiales bacterium]
MTESVTDLANDSGPSDPLSTAISSAEQLAAVREKRGLGKGEVAQRLKLHPRQLEAIERGDWAALPGRAFVRGCVRAYGRLLDVDVEPLLQTIGGFAEAEELKPTATLAAPMPRGGGFGFDGEGKGSRLPWALLGVIGVIAVALFFGRDGDVSKVSSWIGSAEPPASASGADRPVSGTPLVPPPLVPAPGAAPAAGTADGAAPPAAPGVPVVPPQLTAAPPAVPVAAASPPPAPPAPPIRVTVKQDVWVDVRQGDGKSVYMGMVKPGTPLEAKGEAPFSVTIGNASAAVLEFEGKPVDLKPLTSSPNNIAKVKLP